MAPPPPPSPSNVLPPISCLPSVCVRAGRGVAGVCEFTNRRAKRGSLVKPQSSCGCSAPSSLPPFPSLCVAPRRRFWIWHLNKYESALFFFPLSVWGFTLSSQAAEGRFLSLIQSPTQHIKACRWNEGSGLTHLVWLAAPLRIEMIICIFVIDKRLHDTQLLMSHPVLSKHQ